MSRRVGGSRTSLAADKALVEIGGKTHAGAGTAELGGSPMCGEVIDCRGGQEVHWSALGTAAGGSLAGRRTTWWDRDRAAIVRAAKLHESHWNLIVSCDMPFLTRDGWSSLRACGSEARRRLSFRIGEWSGAAVRLLEDELRCRRVQAAFDSGVRKVTEAMKRLPMEVLDESDWKRFDSAGPLFWNMNTPADYEEADESWKRENHDRKSAKHGWLDRRTQARCGANLF